MKTLDLNGMTDELPKIGFHFLLTVHILAPSGITSSDERAGILHFRGFHSARWLHVSHDLSLAPTPANGQSWTSFYLLTTNEMNKKSNKTAQITLKIPVSERKSDGLKQKNPLNNHEKECLICA